MNEPRRQEALSLDHEAILQERLRGLGNGLSEYSFSNLYLFRHIHQYHFIPGNRSYISGKTYDGFSYLMPLFDFHEIDPSHLIEDLNGYDFLFPISEPSLPHFDPQTFSASFNRDDSDYLFRSEKIQTYGGRKLAGKRNLMKQFCHQHTIQALPLTSARRTDAEYILDRWFCDVQKPVTDTDYHPCREALSHFEALNLHGLVFYANGEPGGFLLARELLPRMCVFHFAKGQRKFKGIFQYMFHHFANHHAGRYEFYNFEQDLGKPNFRKTKESYHPDRILHKYRVTLANTNPATKDEMCNSSLILTPTPSDN